MTSIKNLNEVHQDQMGLLDKIGLNITNLVGTMWTAIAFAILACISLPAALQSKDAIIIVAWIAQTFLQLVLLPIIIVGQNQQTKHAQLKADQEFDLNVKEEKQNEYLEVEIIKLHQKLDKLLEGRSRATNKRKK